MEYKETLKLLRKYGKLAQERLTGVVGVKTGRLRDSIEYDVDPDQDRLIIKMLDYGKYVNPWIRKTGSRSKPGYIRVLDDLLEELYREAPDSFAADVEIEFEKLAKKYR